MNADRDTNANSGSEEAWKRMCWASRRGMLELDLVLVPFVQDCYRLLAPEDQQRYLNLMESEDTDLFSWFLGRQRPDDSELAIIVDQIIDYARSGDSSKSTGKISGKGNGAD